MAYLRNDLISRPAYSSEGALGNTPVMSELGGVWDTITGALSSVVGVYGTEQQAVGAQAALTAQNRDLAAALAAQQGPSATDLLLVGGVGIMVIMMIRHKKAAAKSA